MIKSADTFWERTAERETGISQVERLNLYFVTVLRSNQDYWTRRFVIRASGARVERDFWSQWRGWHGLRTERHPVGPTGQTAFLLVSLLTSSRGNRW
jgi:hypothetical protein